MDRNKLEKEINDKGLNATRLSPEDIDNLILTAQYHFFTGTTVVVCCLTLKNGFHVVGEFACVSLENFDEDIGKKIAKEKAKDKIRSLEGYFRESLLDSAKSSKSNE